MAANCRAGVRCQTADSIATRTRPPGSCEVAIPWIMPERSGGPPTKPRTGDGGATREQGTRRFASTSRYAPSESSAAPVTTPDGPCRNYSNLRRSLWTQTRRTNPMTRRNPCSAEDLHRDPRLVGTCTGALDKVVEQLLPTGRTTNRSLAWIAFAEERGSV